MLRLSAWQLRSRVNALSSIILHSFSPFLIHPVSAAHGATLSSHFSTIYELSDSSGRCAVISHGDLWSFKMERVNEWCTQQKQNSLPTERDLISLSIRHWPLRNRSSKFGIRQHPQRPWRGGRGHCAAARYWPQDSRAVGTFHVWIFEYCGFGTIILNLLTVE